MKYDNQKRSHKTLVSKVDENQLFALGAMCRELSSKVGALLILNGDPTNIFLTAREQYTLKQANSLHL